MIWRCPKCKSKSLEVAVVTWARLIQRRGGIETDVTEARDGSHEWDGSSAMQCRDCGYNDKASEFATGHRKRKPEPPPMRTIPVFVGTISTLDPSIYGGPRISVGNTEAEALADMREFLEDEEDENVQEALEAGNVRDALDAAFEAGIIQGWSISEPGDHSIEVRA